MPLSVQDKPSLEAVQTLIAEKSLRDYVTQAWHVVEPGRPFVPGYHIDAICEHLEAVTVGQIRRLLINIPPRYGKSLLVSVFWPTWAWATDPEIRWLFASYAMPLAIRDSLKCRRVIGSPWYQDRWGHVYQLTGDQNLKSVYENDKTGYRLCTSVEAGVTGQGGDFLCVDDAHDTNQGESEPIRKATIDWWDGTMTTRFNDLETGRAVIIGQRVHEQDLSGHLLAQGGWVHLMLPGEYEPKRQCVVLETGWKDWRTYEGELLWPAKVGPAATKSLRAALGEYRYAGQIQQRPSPAEGGKIKRAWWRFYKERPALNTFDEIVQSWDMAFKKTTDSDYVVGQVWGRIGANKYLLDQDRARRDFPETVKAVMAMSVAWPTAYAKFVEDKANGPAVIDTLRQKIEGLIAVNPKGGKEARVAAVSPQIEAGNVWLPAPATAPWVDGFIEECASFPNGAHADQCDAMSQALLRLAAVLEIYDIDVRLE